MPVLTRRDLLALLLAAPAAVSLFGEDSGGWVSLFDGHSLNGWKANEHERAFKAENGQIVAHGKRAHLFYTGTGLHADFKNFEFSAEVMTRPGADSGIYFHTGFQPSGWPVAGFEVQVNNTSKGDNRKTGSLFAVRNVYKQYINDNQWFRIHILVRGKQVQIRLNDMLVVDYVEPNVPFRADPKFERVLNHGTFALQAHGPQSTTYFKNLRVRSLPESAAQLSDEEPQVDELYRDIMRLGEKNFPMVDYHVHLKGGLTLEQALANSRRLGINYGIAVNCGQGFPVHSDDSVREYLATMKGQPCYVALQGEGREWMTLTSPESIAAFDYCFTDAMTFTDDHGKRMRIWLPEEIGVIPDSQAFMEMYVERIVGVMREPIDIYANASFLPQQIAADYDKLWTPERMQKVIDAAVENNVAIEINNRYKIPSARFIKQAKSAGAKFSFGTNNTDANLGALEYPIQMVKECELGWQDIFVPKPDGQKPIQVKK